MELKIYLKMIAKNWWMILLTMFIAINVTVIITLRSPTLYETKAKYIVAPSLNLFAGGDLIDSMQALESRTIVNTYNEMINSDSLFRTTLNALSISTDDPRLENVTRSSIILSNTNFIEITVKGEDPQLITDLANKLGEEGADQVNELYNDTYIMSEFDPAVVPVIPVSPKPVRDISVSAALSLVVGICLAFLFEQIKMPLDEIRKRNQMDKVANCYNTKYFLYTLDQGKLIEENHPISVGMIEFTGLTTLLENLPQTIQQQLLTRITHLLRNEVRGNDVIGRMGTSTFSIMMFGTPEFAAQKTIDRIKNHLSISLPVDEEQIQLMPIVNAAAMLDGETASDFLERIHNDLGKPMSQSE